MSDQMPEAVPVDTLIEHNRISHTSNGVFAEGDYTLISQNRITKGRGRQAIGIRVGLPGGRVPVGTEIVKNLVAGFAVGMNLLAEDSLVAKNLVCMNWHYGVLLGRDNNLIEANRIIDTVGIDAAGGLAIFSLGNLVIRNVLKRNWPFDLTVENPAENDLVENRCERSSPPHLCNRSLDRC